MAWTSLPAFTTGEVLTSTVMNDVLGNLNWLFGDSSWTAVGTFLNSWSSTSSPAVSYLREGNTVFMRGELTGGSNTNAAFTLPTGYRPSGNVYLAVVYGLTGVGTLSVTSAGDVIPEGGSGNPFVDSSFSII